MSEGRDRKATIRLEFMFKVISASKIALDYWISIPAFANAMLDKMDRHEPINNETVLQVMEEIYNRDLEPIRNTPQGVGINFYRARKAINQLRRAVGERPN